MPTYEYQCPSCGYKFEEFQSIVDDPVSECPKCHKTPHRIISGGVGLIFKGTGFYETDYKRKGSKSESKEAGTSSSADTSKPAAGSDSTAKPAPTKTGAKD